MPHQVSGRYPHPPPQKKSTTCTVRRLLPLDFPPTNQPPIVRGAISSKAPETRSYISKLISRGVVYHHPTRRRSKIKSKMITSSQKQKKICFFLLCFFSAIRELVDFIISSSSHHGRNRKRSLLGYPNPNASEVFDQVLRERRA